MYIVCIEARIRVYSYLYRMNKKQDMCLDIIVFGVFLWWYNKNNLIIVTAFIILDRNMNI